MTEKELMMTSILDCDRTALYVEPLTLNDEQSTLLRDMEERRQAHEPLQYILGYTEFMNAKIKVDPCVLIPRPETELLVENILEFAMHHTAADLRILDIGTGSGNIAISLAKALPRAHIFAIDISFEALSLARHNARLNSVINRIDFVHIDLLDFIENYRELEKRFDIIVSNPPYIPTSALETLPLDVKKEPRIALDGGEDGLKFIRRLIVSSDFFLKSGGYFACEIGDGQKADIENLLKQNQTLHYQFHNDYTGTPRFFTVRE